MGRGLSARRFARPKDWSDHGLLRARRRSARRRDRRASRCGLDGARFYPRRPDLPPRDRHALPVRLPSRPGRAGAADVPIDAVAPGGSTDDVRRPLASARHRLGHRHRALRSGQRRTSAEYARHRHLRLCRAAGPAVQRRTMADHRDRRRRKRDRHGLRAQAPDRSARAAGRHHWLRGSGGLPDCGRRLALGRLRDVGGVGDAPARLDGSNAIGFDYSVRPICCRSVDSRWSRRRWGFPAAGGDNRRVGDVGAPRGDAGNSRDC